MENTLQREITMEELAEASGLSVEEATEAIDLYGMRFLRSLYSDDGELAIPADNALDWRNVELDQVIDTVFLEELTEDIPDVESRIMRLYYEEDLTQVVIAEMLGLTQIQVSRILAKAIKDCRAKCTGEEY